MISLSVVRQKGGTGTRLGDGKDRRNDFEAYSKIDLQHQVLGSIGGFTHTSYPIDKGIHKPVYSPVRHPVARRESRLDVILASPSLGTGRLRIRPLM
jgi:hypothetical protein